MSSKVLLARLAGLALESAEPLVELGELGAARARGPTPATLRRPPMLERAQPRGSSQLVALRAASSACVRANAFSASWSVARRASICASRSSGVVGSSGRAPREVGLLLHEQALARSSSRSRRFSSCACAASPTAHGRGASAPAGTMLDAALDLALGASASSRSLLLDDATRSVSSRRRRPSSSSAAMRIARRRSCSVSIETGSVLRAAEKGHASMICASRSFSCFDGYAARSRRSSARARRTISSRSPKRRRAFSMRSACQSSCRRASRSLISSLYGRVEAVGESLPELLALLRELLDLGMDLIRCHARL